MTKRLTVGLVLALAVSACGGGDSAPTWEVSHTSTDWWMSTVSVTESDQWVVGGTTTEGKILRFDGSEVTNIDHGFAVGLLNWVHRFDDGSLVVVGNEGAVLRSRDGSTWTRDDPPTDQDLWGVWGSSPDDIWAVGGDTSNGVPTVLRDTGAGFETVVLPDLERPGVQVFFKVWGSSGSDVYVVGQKGAVLHWDGTELTEQLIGIGEDLIGVWGTGPDRVVTVGGRRNAQAALWDGAEWRVLDLARHPGLNGVWLDDDTVHVVGIDGVVGTIDFVTGTESISSIDTPVALHAVAGTAGTLTAVGGDFSTGEAGPFLGQIATAARD